ncbi:MAG: hypothetical protein ABSD59_08850 [Terracidiphilus sp.]|jgi:hypothetical protein
MKSSLGEIAGQRAVVGISSLLLAAIAAGLLPSGFATAQSSAHARLANGRGRAHGV